MCDRVWIVRALDRATEANHIIDVFRSEEAAGAGKTEFLKTENGRYFRQTDVWIDEREVKG